MNKDHDVAHATESLQALRDIDFIKQIITRNEKKMDQSPPYLFIWGTFLMLGMIGMQFDNETWPMWYWPIAAVLSSVLSAVTGIRQSRNMPKKQGGTNGWMYGLPFLVMMVAGFFMMATGMVEAQYIPLFWFMLVGILYVAMGSLMGKGPVMIGIWFILLSAATRLFFLDYQFLVLGLLGGGSLVLAGVLLQRRRGRHE
ncbi:MULTISPECIES: hypothetical protein [Bacillales]|uniref:hypothetical protein n=1 Tax=Bacillales TaxID=1385 RepID=UPI0006A7EE98|nr:MULTISPECIES: hypothetical protein [Bacillales]OBZ07749.1 hypothetical protein A7975_28910 [Bacillus sp. FJAT-26390]